MLMMISHLQPNSKGWRCPHASTTGVSHSRQSCGVRTHPQHWSCHSKTSSSSSSSSSTITSALPKTQVEFLNHRSEKLAGTLLDPEHAADGSLSMAAAAGLGAAPVVILAHGYMSSQNSELLVRLATALARNCHLASLRFDFSGNGDSGGAFRYGQYRSEAQELRCAKQHLEQQLGRRVVAMIGHSKGATDVLLYASQWDDLPCVVNLAGRCDVQKGVLERLGPEVLEQLDRTGQVQMTGRSHRGPFTWHLRKEDLDDRLATDMPAACSQIKKTAVLTVHGDADADVPVADAIKFDKLIQNHQLVVLEGADHCFSSTGAMYHLADVVLPFIMSNVHHRAPPPAGDQQHV